MQRKNWVLLNKNNTKDDVLKISKDYNLPPIVATILLNRGITDIKSFLSDDTNCFYDPFLMLGMQKACDIIKDAISEGKKITVYGDYDVDGITSTAILVSYLRKHGANADYYIPDRLEEGYGINIGAIEKIAKSGTGLLITVDCGITAISEIERAKELGVEVIVTDHHECKEILPEPSVILNPKQPNCPYPFKKLAGVGVVFKLCEALTRSLKFHLGELYDEYLDLVAIGTIADVMPLTDENRIIVKKGLSLISYTSNKGIKALVETADLKDANHITTASVGFAIAPRINAAGRVGNPDIAARLLLAKDDAEAKRCAEILSEENQKRQETESTILNEALCMIEDDPSYADDYVLVLAKEGWHHGIIGIVASKISERFNKPTILIGIENGIGKGSGRSIRAFNLFMALENCKDLLVKFGGHELAAGLSVTEENAELFRKKINEYAKSVLSEEDFIPIINIDSELPLKYVNLSTLERLSILEPYGMGNSTPVFYAKNLTVISSKLLKDEKHIKLLLTDGSGYVGAIGFGMGKQFKNILPKDKVDIAFSLSLNEFRGEKQAQIVIKDIRYSKALE